MRKLLDEIGPLLAGFQIAVSIVGFFGIGAVAKWILENWFPFTRWVWSELLTLVNLPDLSKAEKDALTTLAFFAPMAISSFISWRTRDRSEPEQEPTPEAMMASSKELRLRIYASLIGAAFMVIVGGSVIQDTITLFTTEAAVEEVAEANEPILNVESFARLGLFFTILGLIAAIAAALYFLTRLNGKLRERTDRFFGWLGSNARPIKRVVSHAALSTAWGVISSLASLVSFATTFGGIVVAANELGPIRTVSPLLVLVFLMATVLLNPARLLKTAGVVIAFVVASLGWDFAIFVVQAVENAPT